MAKPRYTEYDWVSDRNIYDFIHKLNVLAEEGWEVVTTTVISLSESGHQGCQRGHHMAIIGKVD